jgi:hypothetical protein
LGQLKGRLKKTRAVEALAAVALLLPCALVAQAPALVRGAVDDMNRVRLQGNVHPMAQPRFDKGEVEESFAAGRLLLLLKRSPQQESDLEQFLEESHTPGTANYHKWLTPAEFGKRFGAADSDIAAVRAWLESHGFIVNQVHPGRTAIEFSGTAAQVKEAFQTEIHRYANSKTSGYANDRDPQIPAAFADLVGGVSPMNSFHAKPLVEVAGKTNYDPKTHKATREWTYPEGNGYLILELAPADFAVEYDVASVYKAGKNGTGQSIGIISASNVDLSLVNAYRKLFKLPVNPLRVVIDGEDPGENGAATEAYLDVEQSGAIAPDAKVVLYASAGSMLTDPLITSALRAIDDNLVSVTSMSYGTCEAALGASGNKAWLNVHLEAAAQGITDFVSAGDGGSAGCDDFDNESQAKYGLAVNGMGSTPYNVSVGGTDFYYSDYATGGNSLFTYWNGTTTTSPAVSLKEYNPEQAWNGAFGYNIPDGGSYANLLANNGGNIIAGSGGVSKAAIYPTSGPPKGYPKPIWQQGAGVPADKVRDLPDVSLFASNGWNYIYYPICANPGDCVNIDKSAGDAVYITSVGGTSASSPAMAGIQALVNQAEGGSQGQTDWVYYALAGNSSTANSFHDVTVGGNEVPCVKGSPNCVLGKSGQTDGYYAENGYLTGTGYDLATGLGTVDVANLIKNWKSLTFAPTKTTLDVPASFAHGSTIAVSSTVAPASGSGTPTGSVLLGSNDRQIESNSLDVFSLSGGAASASVNNLPGGTYQLTAKYSGDGTYAPSTSQPSTVTVTPESDTIEVFGWKVNPSNGNLYTISKGESIPYGSPIFVDAKPVGVNEAKSKLSLNDPATGSIVFTDKDGSTSTAHAAALNSQGVAEWAPPTLAIGSHAISAAFSGDLSYKASSAPSALTVTTVKVTTTMSVSPFESTVKPGGNVTAAVFLSTPDLTIDGTLPTGNIIVKLGSQSVNAPIVGWGGESFTTAEAVATFTNVPAGSLELSASYAGDANWNKASASYGKVSSTATLPGPKIVVTANKSTFVAGETVTLSATVTGTAGKTQPSGQLYFTWGDPNVFLYYYYWVLKQGTSSSTISFSVAATQLAPGQNEIVATYCGEVIPFLPPKGCTGDASYSPQSSAPLGLTLNASDFSITTLKPEIVVAKGGSGTGSITLTPIEAYSGAVSVTCAAPAGITCTLAAASPIVGANGATDELTLKASSTMTAGTYPIVVTATGGGHIHTAQILVAVH